MLKPEEKLQICSGRWEIDCPEMCLRSRAEGGATYRGPGTIRVADTGAITFKLYARSEGTDEPLTFGAAVAPGTIIPEAHFFDLEARDSNGRRWTAERLRPESNANPGLSSVIWTGEVPALIHRSDIPPSIERGGLHLEFFADVEIPCNQRTESTTSIAGAQTSKSWMLNVAKFTACGYEFLVKRDEGCLSVEATAPGPAIPPHLDLRITEALQFVLARAIPWSIQERFEGTTHQVEIRRLPRDETKPRLQRPIAPQPLDHDGAGWRLFGAYLEYVLPEPSARWHRLSQLVHSAIEGSTGSLNAMALDLTVSVEGVLRLAFRGLSTPPPEFQDQISAAQDLIKKSAIPEPTRQRISNSVGAMKGFRAQLGLDRLVEKGAVSAEEASAWRKLRNKSAHADEMTSLDIQTFLDLCHRVTVLFYRLIFTAIGYEGPYTDYGTRGDWPSRRHQRVNIEVAPLANAPESAEEPATSDEDGVAEA